MCPHLRTTRHACLRVAPAGTSTLARDPQLTMGGSGVDGLAVADVFFPDLLRKPCYQQGIPPRILPLSRRLIRDRNGTKTLGIRSQALSLLLYIFSSAFFLIFIFSHSLFHSRSLFSLVTYLCNILCNLYYKLLGGNCSLGRGCMCKKYRLIVYKLTGHCHERCLGSQSVHTNFLSFKVQHSYFSKRSYTHCMNVWVVLGTPEPQRERERETYCQLSSHLHLVFGLDQALATTWPYT